MDNYQNRISRIYRLDGQAQVDIAHFAYDALGRRISKVDDVASTQQFYYYNDQWQVLSEYDSSGQRQASFIYGNYIDEPLVYFSHWGWDWPMYYLHDHLYSTAALLYWEGSIACRYEYDAYGRPTVYNSTFTTIYPSEGWGNPYLFTGRRMDWLDDGELTIQLNRHRYYNPELGRWYTHDPLGIDPFELPGNFFLIDLLQYMDGMSLYAYVISNPMNYMDSMGLYPGWKHGERGWQPPHQRVGDFPHFCHECGKGAGTITGTIGSWPGAGIGAVAGGKYTGGSYKGIGVGATIGGGVGFGIGFVPGYIGGGFFCSCDPDDDADADPCN